MPSSPPVLSTAPLPHLAMDYARLRSEGLRLLGELAGEQWSDFNAHDPGITILEQLCYAITDLAYRIEFSIPDLLAGGEVDAHASLPSAATILGCRPVTVTDLRKLAKDAGGGTNAWLELAQPACPFFHHATSGELHLRADPSALESAAVVVHGLHRVWLPSSEDGSDATRRRAVARLHRARPVCEDLAVEVLRSQPIWIDATIEVAGGVAAQQILDAIVTKIEAYLAPRVEFESLAEAQARCEGNSEEIFDGPTLERGFLCDRNLAESERRKEIYASDLIHAINDVDSVRAVGHLSMATSANGTPERWALTVADDAIPTLASGSSLVLLRDGLPLPLDADAVSTALARQRRSGTDPILPLAERDLAVTPGRDRQLGRYHSILTQLPLVYGVGRFGLPPSASPARRGRAKQLQAYLLLFDQLLANCFAQLAHARELFSHFGEAPRTYFGQVVEDPVIDLDVLRSEKRPGDHAKWLDEAVVSTAVDELGSLDRRARFLGHLLARYAEELDEVDTGSEAEASERTLADIRRKLAFLSAYPHISAGRGAGCDVFAPDSVCGLADRLRLELGLPRDQHPGFEIVEHVLLRPIAEDLGQLGDEGEELVPVLGGVDRADPFSRQLSVVFREPDKSHGEVAAETFERLVERLIVEHAPAHLGVTLHWLGDTDDANDWSDFLRDHQAFRQALTDYRALALLGSSAPADQRLLTHQHLRDSRDRVIEHLGLGGTYPLRDIELPELVIVPADTPGKISLGFAQAGVTYRLCDRRSGAGITNEDGDNYEIVGAGGPAELPTPVIVEDVSYSIVAIKPAGNFPEIGPRHAWLHTKVTLKEGVDTTLDAVIRAPVLNRSIDNPKSTDARIVYYGQEVEVEVHLSQEGVLYQLVDNADSASVLSQAQVVGTGDTIVLTTVAVSEDIDLRVHASKKLDAEAAGGVTREALLDIVLPLRVRADPSLEFVAAESVVTYAGDARVRVRKSQTSVRYRVWARDTFDRDYLFDDDPTAQTIDVAVGEGDQARVVRVRRPVRRRNWKAPDRCHTIDSLRKGNGTTLSFVLSGVQRDQTFVVQAVKTHELGPLDQSSRGIRRTGVQLVQACAVLVEPNSNPGLRLRVRDGDPTVELEDGEAGVHYTLVEVDTQAEAALPGYFHKRDDDDATYNKGVDQLRVEVDLAIVADPEQTPDDRAKQAPLVPSTDLSGAPAEVQWQIFAYKAMTGLELELEGQARVGPALTLRSEPAQVEAGTSATIVVEASETGQRYELLDESGELVGEAVEGSGEGIELPTGAIEQTTTFEVRVTPVAEDPIVVERLASVIVEV